MNFCRFPLSLAGAILLNACVSANDHSEVSAQGDNVRAQHGNVLKPFCAALGDEPLAEVFRRATFVTRFAGSDSGILADDAGVRIMKTLTVDQCGEGRGAVTLRFTEDAGGGLTGSELFVKDHATGTVVGLALSAEGAELAEVPTELVKDKIGYSGVVGAVVRTRSGCFACHGRVSTDFEVPGAAEFWASTIPATSFLPADLPRQGGVVPEADAETESPNFRSDAESRPPQPDDDGDGVANGRDLCAQTPAGANAWADGEWAGCSEGQVRD